MTARSVRDSSSPAVGSLSSLSIPACGPAQPKELRLISWMAVWGQSALASREEVISQLPCQPCLCCRGPASLGKAFHPHWHHCSAEPPQTPPPPLPSLLAHCHPNSLGSCRFFCSLVGNFIRPFQVGQEQILDLLAMKCFYLNSTKEAQWKDCSCWAKALHLLRSSYAFTSGTSVKALLTLADVPSFHRKLVNLSLSTACSTYLWENVVFDCLARSCNDRTAISR